MPQDESDWFRFCSLGLVVDTARTACLLMHEGHTPEEVAYGFAAETDVSLHDATQLVATAAHAYSNC
jgi:uncharacterized protein DUF732